MAAKVHGSSQFDYFETDNPDNPSVFYGLKGNQWWFGQVKNMLNKYSIGTHTTRFASEVPDVIRERAKAAENQIIKHSPNKVIWTFDNEDARGEITIERTGVGCWIAVNGQPLAQVDLYHVTDTEDDIEPLMRGNPMLVIEDGNEGDPVGYAMLTDEGVFVTFEYGVERVADLQHLGLIYGYPTDYDNWQAKQT